MAFPVEQDATSKQDKLQGGGHYAAPRQQSQASSRGVDPQFAYLCGTGDFVFDCFRVFHAVASTGCWWPTKHTNTEYTAPKINALVGTSDSFPAGQWSVTVSLVCQSANTPHRSWYLVSLTPSSIKRHTYYGRHTMYTVKGYELFPIYSGSFLLEFLNISFKLIRIAMFIMISVETCILIMLVASNID